MSKLNLSLLTGSMVFMLGACTTTGDFSSPYTKPEVGSVIELKEEISARNGKRIYLQDGYVLEWKELEKLQPYCQFLVDRPGADMRQPLTVEPGSFTVDRVYRQKDIGALDGLQFAMADGETETDHGSSQRTMSTYMELSSVTQPDVTDLVCAQWADPATRYHVSVEEIIRSLGDIAEFIPPR